MPVLAHDSHTPLPRSLTFGILLTLATLVSACSLTPVPGDEPAPDAWATLPIVYENEYFFVPMVHDDDPERTLLFLYDTGASITVVDPDSLAATSSWTPSQGGSVRFGNLQCGPLRLGDLPAQTYELDHLQQAVGRPFDGILGYRALDRLLVELDYEAETFRIAEGALPPPDGQEVFPLFGDQRPYLDVEIEGRRRRLLVDTGSGMGFEVFEDSGWDWRVEPVTVGSSMNIEGLQLAKAGRLKQPIGFLGRQYHAPLVRLATGSELVGTEILRDYRLTFDLQNQRLRIVTSLGPDVAPAPHLGTGAIFRPEADGLIVLQVIPGSPAEKAGIRVGDEVQRVALTPGLHHRMEVPGQTYRLRRGSRHLHVDIPFANLVPLPRGVAAE